MLYKIIRQCESSKPSFLKSSIMIQQRTLGQRSHVIFAVATQKRSERCLVMFSVMLSWRNFRISQLRGSSCHLSVRCGRRCCSSPAPRRWTRPCRTSIWAPRLEPSHCQTASDTDSSVSVTRSVPKERTGFKFHHFLLIHCAKILRVYNL